MNGLFRVQTVKLVGPGLRSMSPARRRKARSKKGATAVQSARTGEQ